MAKVPKKFHKFFWNVRIETLDTEESSEFIIGRILQHGTLDAVQWLRKTFGDEKIREYVAGPRRRGLSPKKINFWHKIYKIRPEECTPTFSIPDRLRFWKY